MPTALEIFRMLIDDPYYQAQNGQTREEVVWSEAQQRERQHRNNQAALSLAWDGASSVKSLWNFINKAEGDEERGYESEPSPTKTVVTTPLSNLNTHMSLHAAATKGENNYLFTFDRDYGIQTVRGKCANDINALRILFENNRIKSTTNQEKRDIRKVSAAEFGGQDRETASEKYEHNVLDSMLTRYTNLELDERGLHQKNRLGTGLEVGKTEFTNANSDLVRLGIGSAENIATALAQISQERKRVLIQIANYLPTRGELPSFEGQQAFFMGEDKEISDVWRAGDYSQREELADSRSRPINWSRYDLNDPETVEDLILKGHFSADEYKNMIADERHNELGIAFYLTKNKNVFPEFNSLDPTRLVMGRKDDPEAVQAQDELLYLTMYNPNKRLGAENLTKLLKACERQTGEEEAQEGYFRIDPKVNELLLSIDESQRQEVLTRLMESNNFVQLLNPDKAGNSNFLTVLEDILMEQRDENTPLKGVDASKPIGAAVNPDHARLRGDVWDFLLPSDDHTEGPVQDLMRDLEHQIDPREIDPDAAKGFVNSDEFMDRVAYEDHQPVNALGHPIPGMSLQMGDADAEEAQHTPLIAHAKGELADQITEYENALTDEAIEGENPDYAAEKQAHADKWADPLAEREAYHGRLNTTKARILENIKARGKGFSPKLGKLFSRGEAEQALKMAIHEKYQELRDDPDLEQILQVEGGELSAPDQSLQIFEAQELQTILHDVDRQKEILGRPLDYFPTMSMAGLSQNPTDTEKLMLGRIDFALDHDYMREDEPPEAGQLPIYHDLHTNERYPESMHPYAAMQGHNTYEQEEQRVARRLAEIKRQTSDNNQPDVDMRRQLYRDAIAKKNIAVQNKLKPQFIAQRRELLSSIIDEMVNTGVSASKALENFNERIDVPQSLIPAELDWLNSLASPVIESMYIAGDIATALHGQGENNIPNTEHPNPTMILGFEPSKGREFDVRQFVENNDLYKQIVHLLHAPVEEGGLGFGIDVTIGEGRRGIGQGDHIIDIHSDEQLTRNLNPYKSGHVVNPAVDMFPPEIQELLKRGELQHRPNTDEDKPQRIDSRSREKTYNELLRDNWNEIPQDVKDVLYALPGVGVPVYKHHRTDADGNPLYKDEPTNGQEPAYYVKVNGEWLMALNPSGNYSAVRRERFIEKHPENVTEQGKGTARLLSDVLNSADLADIRKLISTGDADTRDTLIERPPPGGGAGIQIQRMESVPDEVELELNVYPDTPTNPQKDGFDSWVNNLRGQMRRTVHPIQGHLHQSDDGTWAYLGTDFETSMRDPSTNTVHSVSLLDILRFLPYKTIQSALDHMNERDSTMIVGEFATPQVFYRPSERPTGNMVKNEAGEEVMETEGLAGGLRNYHRVSSGPDKGQYIEAPENRNDPSLKDEEGNWIVEIDEKGRTTRFGIGARASGIGSVEAHIRNAIRLYSENEAAIYKDAQRQTQITSHTASIVDQLIARQESDTTFDRNYILNPLIDIMTQWHKLDDIPRFEVPDVLRDVINENLPMFQSMNPSEQANLDAFLANFYRQFARQYDNEIKILEALVQENEPNFNRQINRAVTSYQKDLQNKIDQGETWEFTDNEGNLRSGTYTAEEVVIGFGPNRYIGPLSDAITARRKTAREAATQQERDAFETGELPGMVDKMLHGDEYTFYDKDGNLISSDQDNRSVNFGPGTKVEDTIHGGISKIPQLPLRFIYPVERFDKRAMQDMGAYKVPAAYLWVMQHEKIFSNLAQDMDIPISDILDAMTNPSSGLIDGTHITTWLKDRGFLTEYRTPAYLASGVQRFLGTVLPDKMIQDPEVIDWINVQNRPTENLSPAMQQGLKIYTLAQAEMAVERAKQTAQVVKRRAGLINPYFNYDDRNANLHTIGRDQDFQQQLISLYGDPNFEYDPEIQRIPFKEELDPINIEQMYSEGGDPWRPPTSTDPDGRKYYDLFSGDLDFAKLHERLEDMLRGIERIPREQTYARGEQAAEGQYSMFTLRDAETGAVHTITPDSDIPMQFKDWLHVASQDVDLRNFYTEQQFKEATIFDFLSTMVFVYDWMSELATLQGSERIPMPHRGHRTLGGVHVTPDNLKLSLESLALHPVGIEPPDGSSQFSKTQALAVLGWDKDEDDPQLVADTKYFTDDTQLGGGYRVDEPLRPPKTAKDVATQISMIDRFLDMYEKTDYTPLAENKIRERDIRSYQSDLKAIGRAFRIPDIDVHKLLRMEDAVHAWAKNKTTTKGQPQILNLDVRGNLIVDDPFVLFNEDGSINTAVQDFLQIYWAHSPGAANIIKADMFPTDFLVHTVVEEPIESGSNIPFNIGRNSARDLQIFKTLAAYGEKTGAVVNDVPLEYIWDDEGNKPSYDNLRLVMDGYFSRDAEGKEFLSRGVVGRPGSTQPWETVENGIIPFLTHNWDNLFGEVIPKPTSVAAMNRLIGHEEAIQAYTPAEAEPTEEATTDSIIVGTDASTDAEVKPEPEEPMEEDVAALEEFMEQIIALDDDTQIGFLQGMMNGIIGRMQVDYDPEGVFDKIQLGRAELEKTPLSYETWGRFTGFNDWHDSLEGTAGGDVHQRLFRPTGPTIRPQAQIQPQPQPGPTLPDPRDDMPEELKVAFNVVRDAYEAAVNKYTTWLNGPAATRESREHPYVATTYRDNLAPVEKAAKALYDFMKGEGTDDPLFDLTFLTDPANPVAVTPMPEYSGNLDYVKSLVLPWLNQPTPEQNAPEHWRNDALRGQTDVSWEDKIQWLQDTGWKPSYADDTYNTIKNLYYGVQEGQAHIWSNPDELTIADLTLTRIFAPDSSGWPHDTLKNPNDDYFRISDDFKTAFPENQDFAEFLQNLFQFNFTHPGVEDWWNNIVAPDAPSGDLEALQEELLMNHVSLDNWDQNDPTMLKDFKDHRSIIISPDMLNMMTNWLRPPAVREADIDENENPRGLFISTTISAVAVAQRITELLGSGTGNADVLSRPIPRTGRVDRQGQEESEGMFSHPTETEGILAPSHLASLGKAMNSRYFTLLLDRVTDEVKQKIRDHLGDQEWEPPILGDTAVEPWQELRKLLSSDEDSVSWNDNIVGLRINEEETSPHKEPIYNNETGKWENIGANRNWEQQFQEIETYLQALEMAYTTVFNDYPGHPHYIGPNATWASAVGGYTPTVRDARPTTDFSLTKGAYDELVALGFEMPEIAFTRIPGGGGSRTIAEEAFQSESNLNGLNPAWFWRDDPEAVKQFWGDGEEQPYTAQQRRDLESGKYNSNLQLSFNNALHKEQIKQHVIAQHESDSTRFMDADTGEMMEAAKKYLLEPEIIDDGASGADGVGGVGGTGGAGGGDDVITPPPDKRTAQIDQIIHAMKEGGKELTDEDIAVLRVVSDSDLNATHKDVVVTPMWEQRLRGEENPLYDGEYADQKIKEIQAAYKIINGAEIDPTRLESMNMSELNKEHANVHKQVQEYKQKTFVKRANDISAIQPLSEESKQSPHDVQQQYRRIMYHAKLYNEYMDEDKQSELRDLFKDVTEGQSLFDLNALEADIDKFRERQVEAVQNGQSPLLYGSLEHLEQEQQKYERGQQTRQAYIDYLTDPNSGALVSEMRHANNEANVWRQRGEYVESLDGAPKAPDDPFARSSLSSYAPLQSGARLTYHRGRRKGELREEGGAKDDIREDAPDVFVRGGAYGDPDRAYAGPHLTHSDNAPKIFGLPEDLESAYNRIHRSMIDVKQLTREHGLLEEGDVEDKKRALQAYVARGPLYNEFGEEIDLEPINQALIRYSTAIGMFNEAVSNTTISEAAVDAMADAVGYDEEDAHRDMMDQGHNAEGMPIDIETGIEQPAPLYYSQSRKTLVPRVYHAGTRMWYDPEMLDSMQNSEGLSRWVNNPYDLVNEAGVRMGTNEDGSPKFLDDKDEADRYRFGIPAVNSWDDMFDKNGMAIPDAHHGVMVTRVGLYPVGNGTDVKDDPDNEYYGFPGMDENGNLNHDPQSVPEISSAVWALARTNDQLTDPDRFKGPNNTDRNSVTITPEGQFAGGWKEWLENPTVGLLEMPGVRDLPGMRGLDRAVNGLPSQRMGAIDPNLKVSWWTGPQTYAGRATIAGPGSTAMVTGEKGLSRIEALRQHIAGQNDYTEQPKGPTRQETLQNTANELNTQTTGQSTVSSKFLRQVHAHVAGKAKDWKDYSESFMATGKAFDYSEEVLQAHLDAQKILMQEAQARAKGMPSTTETKSKPAPSVQPAPRPTAGQIPIPSSLEPVQPQQVQPVEQESESLENPVQ